MEQSKRSRTPNPPGRSPRNANEFCFQNNTNRQWDQTYKEATSHLAKLGLSSISGSLGLIIHGVCLCSCVSSVGNSVRSIDCRLGKIMIGTFDKRERPVNFFVRRCGDWMEIASLLIADEWCQCAFDVASRSL